MPVLSFLNLSEAANEDVLGAMASRSSEGIGRSF